MVIILALVNKHNYTISVGTVVWALLSPSTSTFYFYFNPFPNTVNVVELWNNNKKLSTCPFPPISTSILLLFRFVSPSTKILQTHPRWQNFERS